MTPSATPPIPGTGLTAPRTSARDIPRPVPLGGGSQTAPTLMQSLDGIVTSVQAREQAANDAAKDVLVSAERTAALMGSIMDRAATFMGMGVGSGITGSMALGGGMPAWAAYAQSGMIGLPGVSMPMVPAGTGGGSATFMPGALPGTATQIHGVGAPPPNSGVPALNATASPEPPPTSAPPPVRLPGRGSGNTEGAVPSTRVPGGQWPSSFEEGKNFSLGDIRQNAARSINRRVSEWATSSEQTLVDNLGNPIKVDGKIQTRRVPGGTPSTAPGVVNMDASGNMVADLAEGYQPSWQEGFAGNVKNIAGNMAKGEGLGEAITSAVPKLGAAAGVAGAAYMAVNKGLDFAEDQRAKNQEFQSMIGGSNAEGFGERMRQNVFRLGMRGTMGGADAEAIYKGAISQYGTQRESRNMYQSAAVDLYRNVGLGGEEAASMLNQAAGAGNNNLYEFADAIREVSRTAKEGGEDARKAREDFSKAFDRQSTFSGGSAAISGAKQTANTQTILGDQFSDADFSGMDSEMMRRRMAQLLGMDYSAFSASQIRGGNQGATNLAQGRSAVIQDALRNIDPTGAMWADANTQVKGILEASGGKGVSQGAINNLAADLQEKYNLDPMVITSTASALAGVQLNENDAMAYFLRYGTDDRLDPATAEKKRQKAMGEAGQQVNSSTTLARLNKTDDPSRYDSLTDSQAKAGRAADEKMRRRVARDLGLDPDEIDADKFSGGFHYGPDGKTMVGGFSESADNGRKGRGQVKNAILNDAVEGRYNPLMSEFYKNYDSFKGSKFEVNVKGKKKAVDAVELARYFSDQVQSDPSAIKIIGGDNANKTIADVLGADSSDPDAKEASGLRDQGKGRNKVGEDVKEAKKNAGKADGTVTISPSPLLERLFNFQTGGAAEMANMNGQAPASSTEIPWQQRSGQN